MESINVEEVEECLEVEIVDPYGFIYLTANIINGRKYIGQRKFSHGWKGYLGSGIILTQAIKKYGRENFNRTIMAIAYSKEELNKLEIVFINSHNAVESDNYYNITHGGDSPMSGRKMSEEHKEKISNSEKGKEVSKETREKISISSKGKTHSEETKEKIRITSEGRLHSEETKEKLRNMNKGELNPMFGKSPSEETRKKISDSNKGKTLGRVRTKEEIRKSSESRTKLTKEQVLEIRDKYKIKEYTFVKLAKEYFVSDRTISNVVKFKGVYKSS